MLEGKDRRLCVKFPMAVQHSVRSMEMSLRDPYVGTQNTDGSEFKEEADRLFARSLCAACMGCKHREQKAQISNNVARMSIDLEAVTFCSKVGMRGEKGTMDPYCPDGFEIHKHEWAHPVEVREAAFTTVKFPGGASMHPTITLHPGPINEKFQNHKTLREIEDEDRALLRGAMASTASMGCDVSMVKKELAEQARYEREDFFRSDSFGKMEITPESLTMRDSSGAARIAMGLLDDRPSEVHFDASGIKDDNLIRAFTGRSDVPESPDAGTW